MAKSFSEVIERFEDLNREFDILENDLSKMLDEAKLRFGVRDVKSARRKISELKRRYGRLSKKKESLERDIRDALQEMEGGDRK